MPLKTIGKFSLSYLQVLDDKGKLDENLEPKLSNTELNKLYRAMYLARQLDSRMLKLQRQGRLGTIPVCTGQEACVCGATFALRDSDWFVGSYRELGGRLMRGEPLINPMIYYNGYEEGSFNPVNDRTLPINIILGSQLPHAVGAAYGSRLKGEKENASLVFFGDGSTSEGDFHEAIN
ncbi:MAG: thiamine pyrophosphate-dependent enzyme, partial [Candidatus Electryonea clarkiae]|nr:thiamine pyrophosphate-dependent enzyme [Candidatus Electryonea clarkiae]